MTGGTCTCQRESVNDFRGIKLRVGLTTPYRQLSILSLQDTAVLEHWLYLTATYWSQMQHASSMTVTCELQEEDRVFPVAWVPTLVLFRVQM